MLFRKRKQADDKTLSRIEAIERRLDNQQTGLASTMLAYNKLKNRMDEIDYLLDNPLGHKA